MRSPPRLATFIASVLVELPERGKLRRAHWRCLRAEWVGLVSGPIKHANISAGAAFLPSALPTLLFESPQLGDVTNSLSPTEISQCNPFLTAETP